MNNLLKMLPMMLRLAGDNEEVREQAAFTAWRVLTGEQISYNCTPFRLSQKHLIVAVLDQTWQNQMERVSGQYLFRLNSLLGAPVITRIEFHINPQIVLKARPHEAVPHEFHRTEEFADELRPAADAITDEALREQFLRAAAKFLERREP